MAQSGVSSVQPWLKLPLTCSIEVGKVQATVEKKRESAVFSTRVILKGDARWLERRKRGAPHPHPPCQCFCHRLLKEWPQVGPRRIWIWRTPPLPEDAQSESKALLFRGYQFCSCWGGGGRVTRGVILMGPVMRVDRLMHGGG